jgi:hypothetical protein
MPCEHLGRQGEKRAKQDIERGFKDILFECGRSRAFVHQARAYRKGAKAIFAKKSMETYMRIRNTTGPYFPLDGKASRKRFMIGRHAPAQDFILLAKHKANGAKRSGDEY